MSWLCGFLILQRYQRPRFVFYVLVFQISTLFPALTLILYLFKKLILKVCHCYKVVFSGANQALYAIFVAYSLTAFGAKLTLL